MKIFRLQSSLYACVFSVYVLIIMCIYILLYGYICLEKHVSVIISRWDNDGRFLFLTFAFLYCLKDIEAQITLKIRKVKIIFFKKSFFFFFSFELSKPSLCPSSNLFQLLRTRETWH